MYGRAASTVRTDHKTVVATMASDVRDRSKTSVKKFIRRRTPNQNASLLLALRSFDDSVLTSYDEPQSAWDAFYQLLHDWLDAFYQIRSISITTREPAFVTPR